MGKFNFEEGQLVLCTVTRIVGTTVFATMDDYGIEGSISFMEIAPGRIRNIREYAFPGKKIVCKILEIKSNYIELSFRRVKVNERNDFNDRYRKEKNYNAMFKTILGEKESIEAIDKIKAAEGSLYDFMDEAKEKPALLEKYISKDKIEKISAIIKEKKVKERIIQQKFSLSSKASNGINLVKKVVENSGKEIEKSSLEVSYIAAGKYLIKIKTKDPRVGDQQLRKMLDNIENDAKKNSCVFNLEKN